MGLLREVLHIALLFLLLANIVSARVCVGGMVGSCRDATDEILEQCGDSCPFFIAELQPNLYSFTISAQNTTLIGAIDCSFLFSPSDLPLYGDGVSCLMISAGGRPRILVQFGDDFDATPLLAPGGLQLRPEALSLFPGAMISDLSMQLRLDGVSDVTPVIVLDYPAEIPSCMVDLNLGVLVDASATYNLGGRPPTSVVWEQLPGPSGPNTALDSILSAATSNNSLTLSIPASVFPASRLGVTEQLRITVTNWIGNSAQLDFSITVRPGRSLLVSGPNHVVQTVRQWLPLSADITNPCGLDFTRAGFAWSRVGGAVQDITAFAETALTNRLIVPPLRGVAPNGTSIWYNLASSADGVSATGIGHLVEIQAASQGVTAVLHPSSRTVPFFADVHLDASESLDYDDVDAELTFTWSCYEESRPELGCPYMQYLQGPNGTIPGAALGPGDYVFEVTVSNGVKSDSAWSYIIVDYDRREPEVHLRVEPQPGVNFETAPGFEGYISSRKQLVLNALVMPLSGLYTYNWTIFTDAWGPSYYTSQVLPRARGWTTASLILPPDLLRPSATYIFSVEVTDTATGLQGRAWVSLQTLPLIRSGDCDLTLLETGVYEVHCSGFEPGAPQLGPLLYQVFYVSSDGQFNLGAGLSLDHDQIVLVPPQATAIGVIVVDQADTYTRVAPMNIIPYSTPSTSVLLQQVEDAVALGDQDLIQNTLRAAVVSLDPRAVDFISARDSLIEWILTEYIPSGPTPTADGASEKFGLLTLATNAARSNLTAQVVEPILEALAAAAVHACEFASAFPSGECVFNLEMANAMLRLLQNVLPAVNMTTAHHGQHVRDILHYVGSAAAAQLDIPYGGEYALGIPSDVIVTVLRGSPTTFARNIQPIAALNTFVFQLPEQVFVDLAAAGIGVIAGIYSQVTVNYMAFLAYPPPERVFGPLTSLDLYDATTGERLNITLETREIDILLPTRAPSQFPESLAGVAFFNENEDRWSNSGCDFPAEIVPQPGAENDTRNAYFRTRCAHLSLYTAFAAEFGVMRAPEGVIDLGDTSRPFRVTSFLIILLIVGALLLLALIVFLAFRVRRRVKWVPRKVANKRAYRKAKDTLETRFEERSSDEYSLSEEPTENSVRLHKPHKKGEIIYYALSEASDLDEPSQHSQEEKRDDSIKKEKEAQSHHSASAASSKGKSASNQPPEPAARSRSPSGESSMSSASSNRSASNRSRSASRSASRSPSGSERDPEKGLSA